MNELIVVSIVSVVAVLAIVAGAYFERKEWQAERKDLLNRLMARDYEQYAEKEIKVKGFDRPMSVVGVEELVSRLQEQERESLPVGMPV